jgi:acetyl-CoA carboxylase biotin carboxyl carrier protein
MGNDVEQLKELYDLMLEKNLDELEIKEADSHIKLMRRAAVSAASFPVMHHAQHSPVAAHAVPTPSSPVAAAASIPAIESPLAGMFYRASSPNSAPFVKEGDVVDPGQTLCIVEAMKVMNEIKAEARCKILKITAENGRSVTAGQALFHIEPA